MTSRSTALAAKGTPTSAVLKQANPPKHPLHPSNLIRIFEPPPAAYLFAEIEAYSTFTAIRSRTGIDGDYALGARLMSIGHYHRGACRPVL